MKQSLLAGVLISTLGTATLVQATPAQAFVLDINPSTSFSSNAPPYASDGDGEDFGDFTGASGTLNFTFSQVNPTQVLLNLGIKNTTNLNTGDGAGATQSQLRRVFFDLPSFLSVASYTGSADFPNIAFDQGFQPFTNNAPTGYPGANPGPNVRFDVEIFFQNGGGSPNTLTAGESTSVSFLLNSLSPVTAKFVEGRFYYGFLNVDGNGPIDVEPLRAALRFQAVKKANGTDAGAGSDKLLAKPEAVPTPALLPALLAVGLGAIRKNKQSEQDA